MVILDRIPPIIDATKSSEATVDLMNRRLVLPVLTASLCLATTTAMTQPLLTYTLTGGTFSGSINGAAFTDGSTTYSMTIQNEVVLPC